MGMILPSIVMAAPNIIFLLVDCSDIQCLGLLVLREQGLMLVCGIACKLLDGEPSIVKAPFHSTQ